MLERERKIAIRLLITGSGVRVPHNPRTGFKELNLWPTTIVVNLLSLINLIKAAGSSALVFKVRDDFGTFNLPPRVILIIFPLARPPR